MKMKTVTGMVGHTFSPSTLVVQGQLGLLHRRKKNQTFGKVFLCVNLTQCSSAASPFYLGQIPEQVKGGRVTWVSVLA